MYSTLIIFAYVTKGQKYIRVSNKLNKLMTNITNPCGYETIASAIIIQDQYKDRGLICVLIRSPFVNQHAAGLHCAVFVHKTLTF